MKQDQPSLAQLLQLCTEERRGTSQEGGGNSRERRNRKSADRLRVMFSRESLLLLPPLPPPTRHSTHTRLFAFSASSFFYLPSADTNPIPGRLRATSVSNLYIRLLLRSSFFSLLFYDFVLLLFGVAARFPIKIKAPPTCRFYLVWAIGRY